MESRLVVVRGWREDRMRNYCLIGPEVQVCKMKRILEMDGSNGNTT
jgi:hypothetical protein